MHFKGEIKITHGVGIIHPAKKRREKRPYAQKFICIARLSAVKNLEFLLLVFAHLPELSLSVVGTGELEEKLKNMASPNVVFLGAIENASLNSLLCAHDMLILPSLKEPWGLVVEEALSAGLPVLVSLACGAQVLVQEGVNGFLFCPKDSARLQELLKNLGASYPTLLEGAQLWSLEDKNRKQIEAYL
ncbi:glycosyltransferase [Helicobacter suis]|uniref:glycosyltransferase n=1 Tax=Helicobacter suis TaxID=104628 RepID=UPI0013D5A32A|nr:glycosyltransferase [Helicobacter suis]